MFAQAISSTAATARQQHDHGRADSRLTSTSWNGRTSDAAAPVARILFAPTGAAIVAQRSGLCRRNRRPGRQAAEAVKKRGVALLRPVRRKPRRSNRHPEFRRLSSASNGNSKLAGMTPTTVYGIAIERKRAADDAGVACKVLAPRTPRPAPRFVGAAGWSSSAREQTSTQRRDAEQGNSVGVTTDHAGSSPVASPTPVMRRSVCCVNREAVQRWWPGRASPGNRG